MKGVNGEQKDSKEICNEELKSRRVGPLGSLVCMEDTTSSGII